MAKAADGIQGDAWELETTSPCKNYHSSYLGNGYLGVQVSKDGTGIAGVEWRRSTGAIQRVPVASYIAGLYEGGPEKLIALPRWSHINFNNGERWLTFESPESITGYRQTLNMKEAFFRTRYTWGVSGRLTDFDISFFVSRADEHLAALRFSFIPHYAGEVLIENSLVADSCENLSPNERASEGKTLWISVVHSALNIKIAQALAIDMDETTDIEQHVSLPETKQISEQIKMNVQDGRRYDFVKYVCFSTSYDSTDPLEEAKRIVGNAKSEGYDRLFREHSRAWAELWESDIIVDDWRLQRRIHSAMYHLFSSVRDGQNHSIPPMGLSFDGWGGRIFWDAEWFMLPALLLLHPKFARSLVLYRYRTLDAAKTNAKLGGYKGAAFAGSTGRTGKGGAAYRPGGMEKQIHIVGDVAWAQWQYYRATRDRDYLKGCASKIIVETARFWASRASYNEKADRYEILGVVPPDESITNPGGPKTINNSAFTNALAQWNLRTAIEVCRTLGRKYPSVWQQIADKMYMPTDQLLDIYLEYDGYDGHLIKQPDVLMLFYMLFPLEHPMDNKKMASNFDYYQKKSDRELGHSFFPSVHPILACRLRRPKEAYALFREWDGFFLPPFETMRECIANEYRVFLTAFGGFLQNLLSGFAGIATRDEELVVDPVLPDEIPRITFKRLFFGGRKYELTVEKESGQDTYNLKEIPLDT